jgi:hypothetical protein
LEQAELALRQQLPTGNFSLAARQKVALLMQEYVNGLKEDKEKRRAPSGQSLFPMGALGKAE